VARYGKQFKDKAISRLRAGESIQDVSLSLDIKVETIQRWEDEADPVNDLGVDIEQQTAYLEVPRENGMILWRKPNGLEITTNDAAGNIQHAESAGWVRV